MPSVATTSVGISKKFTNPLLPQHPGTQPGMALLETGAEVSVMTHRVMEEAGLAMRRGPSLKLISHNGAATTFVGLCENVEIEIGSRMFDVLVVLEMDAPNRLVEAVGRFS